MPINHGSKKCRKKFKKKDLNITKTVLSAEKSRMETLYNKVSMIKFL